jgi:putative addiction module component (TIGR02574 family)
MTRPAKEIVNAAIKLTENDRLQIVEEILASLEPESDDDVDAAWATEVERRSIEIKEGIVRPIPWSEVKSQARKRVRSRSKGHISPGCIRGFK